MTSYISVMTVHDDAITFEIPDLPGFTAQIEGTDHESAITEAREVLGHFLGAMKDAGMDLPAARRLPAIKSHPAVQKALRSLDVMIIPLEARPVGGRVVRVNISLDSYTLERIDHAAESRRLTRSAYLVEAARHYG